MATIIGAKEGSHFQDARRITEIIIAHGADMTRDAIDRAINTWDQLIKIGLNNHQTPKEGVMQKSRNDALMDRVRTFVKMGFCPEEADKMARAEQRNTTSKPAEQPIRWGATPTVLATIQWKVPTP